MMSYETKITKKVKYEPVYTKSKRDKKPYEPIVGFRHRIIMDNQVKESVLNPKSFISSGECNDFNDEIIDDEKKCHINLEDKDF